MARNVRTPGAGAPRALGNVCLAADNSQITPRPLVINRLARRLGISIELAAVVAELAALESKEARR